MEIGFIGLGSMGYPIASNLQQAGHTLTVWNRSPGKAGGLVEAGARLASSPREAVEAGGVVFSMVADDAALLDIVTGKNGFGEKLGAGGIHVSMSTVSEETASLLAQYHHERGAVYLAAPVFGRPDAAAAKKLFVICAGPQTAIDAVKPLFDAIGQRVFVIGDVPAHANIVKLAGNFMIMGVIEALGEAFTLGEKHGVPRQTLHEVLTQSIFPAPIFVNYGAQIAAHQYEPARFKLSLGLKDANLVLAAAGKAQVPMPLASLMQMRYLTSMAKGREQWDWTSAALTIAEDAGVAPQRKS